MRLGSRNAVVSIIGLAWLAVAQAALADHSRLDLISTGPAGGNAAQVAAATAISPNGQQITFYTEESLVPQDTDSSGDVYLRSGTRLILASVGPRGGNGPYGAYGYLSEDGGTVVFSTDESLTADDTDTALDFYRYRIRTGITMLMTPDPVTGSFTHPTFSPNASRLLLFTIAPLVPDDTDGNFDLYLSSFAGARLVTAAPDAAASDASYCYYIRFSTFCSRAEFSADGRRVLFLSNERLVDADADTLADWYALMGSDLELVTPGALTGKEGATFSSDGARMFFTTNEALDPTDTDELTDVYELSAGTLRLLTPNRSPGPGLTTRDVRLVKLIDDGDAILAQTPARLVQADGDDSEDIYLFRDGVPQLISDGPLPTMVAQYPHASLADATPDGSHVAFTTGESLVPEDTDQDVDIYLRTGDGTELVSTGPQTVCPFESCTGGANFRFLSADGRRVFFDSYEQLVPEDTDSQSDLYERFAGATTLISIGPKEPNISPFCGACFFSRNGRRVVFNTITQLRPEDIDDQRDVYAAIARGAPR